MGVYLIGVHLISVHPLIGVHLGHLTYGRAFHRHLTYRRASHRYTPMSEVPGSIRGLYTCEVPKARLGAPSRPWELYGPSSERLRVSCLYLAHASLCPWYRPQVNANLMIPSIPSTLGLAYTAPHDRRTDRWLPALPGVVPPDQVSDDINSSRRLDPRIVVILKDKLHLLRSAMTVCNWTCR